MDQALKARLIGAAVLVALAVVLIPELLTGRKADMVQDATSAAAPGTRTFTIELAGSSPGSAAPPKSAAGPIADAAPERSVAARATGRAADPAAPAASGPAPGSTPAAAPDGKIVDRSPARGADATPPLQSTPAVTASPPPAAAKPEAGAQRGGWSIQVGAFSTRDKADKLAAELKSAGYQAYVSPVSKSGRTLQRVRVGPEADRSRADGVAAKLKARGLPATVVASD